MPKLRRSVILAVVVAVVLGFVAYRLVSSGPSPTELSLDSYLRRVDAGKVATATIHDKDHNVTGELADGTEYKVSFPASYTKSLTQHHLPSACSMLQWQTIAGCARVFDAATWRWSRRRRSGESDTPG